MKGRRGFRQSNWVAPAVLPGVLLLVASAVLPASELPEPGGILSYVVPAEPPSFDGHHETTFAQIQPVAPFHSTLIRINPDNPASSTANFAM